MEPRGAAPVPVERTRAYVAFGASTLLLVSLALQVAQFPLTGPITVLSSRNGMAPTFVVCAIVAAAAAAFGAFRLLVVPGVVVLGTMFFWVYNFNHLKEELAGKAQGTIFAGPAQSLLATVQLEPGVAFIFAAAVLLIHVALFPRIYAARRGPGRTP